MDSAASHLPGTTTARHGAFDPAIIARFSRPISVDARAESAPSRRAGESGSVRVTPPIAAELPPGDGR